MKLFETFKCSRQNLLNSLCQFWNDKSIPLQILYTCSVSWRLLLCTFLAQAIYALVKRTKLKWKSLRLSSAGIKNPQIPLEILHHSSLSWHVSPQWILSSYLFHFGLKDSIKIPILRLSNPLVKICHIPDLIFQATSQFFFKFCINLECYQRQIIFPFLGQTLNTFHNRSKWMYKFWRLGSAQVKFLQILVIFETKVFNFCIIFQGRNI